MADDYCQRASHLAETTVLSRREADVQALKEEGLTHERIGDRLGLSKSTVDEYSRRINTKIDLAKGTVRELGDSHDG